MAKTLYEGYRIGKNGGERWVGTIRRDVTGARELGGSDGPRTTGGFETARKAPRGGSVIKVQRRRADPK